MRRAFCWLLLFLITVIAACLLKLGAPGPTSRLSVGEGAKTSVQRSALPLSFEINRGQVDNRVKFLAHEERYGLFLTQDELVMELGSRAPRPAGRSSAPKSSTRRPTPNAAFVRMKLLGAAPDAAVRGDCELPGKANYFIGNDPAKWRTNISTYASVLYQNVYPGIDLVYYGNQGGQLEYDFIVAPGADPAAIAMELKPTANTGLIGSAAPLRISADGDLIIPALDGGVRLHKPLVYQEADASIPVRPLGGSGGFASLAALAWPGTPHGRNDATTMAGTLPPVKLAHHSRRRLHPPSRQPSWVLNSLLRSHPAAGHRSGAGLFNPPSRRRGHYRRFGRQRLCDG
jgi:hypothetical protein